MLRRARPPCVLRHLWSRSFTQLPTIDVSALVSPSSDVATRRAVGAQLHDACLHVGFFNIVGHGVPPSVQRDTLSATRSWFETASFAEKARMALSPASGFRGYASLGKNVTQGQPDAHEGLDLYCEEQVGGVLSVARNPWPTSDEGALRAASLAWVEQGLRVGRAVMRGIALGLELPERTFEEPGTADRSYWVLRLIHYPLLPPSAPGISCGEHTDYGLLTLVLQDEHASALEVRNAQGVWVRAPPQPGALTCNLGDMLRIWTNGLYTPTLHRVVHDSGFRSRVSAPFFYEPEFAARVAPLAKFGAPRVEPVLYGTHLERKVTSNFGADGMM
jgi:isopenicillin N synthase-like dioxygenase